MGSLTVLALFLSYSMLGVCDLSTDGCFTLGAVVGAVVFRLVYALALRLNMPAFMLKLVSSVIVIFAIAGPYMKARYPELHRRLSHKYGKGGGARA